MVERAKESGKIGARQVIKCLGLNPDDWLLIITDTVTREIAESIHAEAINSEILVLEDLAARPLTKFPSKLLPALKKATATILCCAGQKGELATFRRPLLDYVRKNKIRHAHMIGVTEQIMRQGMAADYGKVRKLSKKVHGILCKAKKIRVTTSRGTDFTAEFNGQPWIISDGAITPEKWSNLPDGEVWTAPTDVNGVVVIDGVLGDSLSKYGLLTKSPLTLKIRDGRVIDVGCHNLELIQGFVAYIKSSPNADRIGEFAVGTNTHVKKLIGVMLQDEKYPGVHIAVGNPYPELTNANWKSSVHCDAVILKPTVLVDGRAIMEKGKFLA